MSTKANIVAAALLLLASIAIPAWNIHQERQADTRNKGAEQCAAYCEPDPGLWFHSEDVGAWVCACKAVWVVRGEP